jgi:hypothetical protein
LQHPERFVEPRAYALVDVPDCPRLRGHRPKGGLTVPEHQLIDRDVLARRMRPGISATGTPRSR